MKTGTKSKVSYSIDTAILHKFNELAKKEGYNKSQVINKMIENFIKDKSSIKKESI